MDKDRMNADIQHTIWMLGSAIQNLCSIANSEQKAEWLAAAKTALATACERVNRIEV